MKLIPRMAEMGLFGKGSPIKRHLSRGKSFS
jgi:hypothetical protein